MRLRKAKERQRLKKIRFRGQELEFTAEVRFLLADETASESFGAAPRRRLTSVDAPRVNRVIAQVLDAFGDVDRADEGYDWLVTPIPELDNVRPIESLAAGGEVEVLETLEHYLAA